MEGKKIVLMPCPCCGNKAELIGDCFHVYYVECTICGLATPRRATMESAIALWNRRSHSSLPSAEPGTYEERIKKMDTPRLAKFLYRFKKNWHKYSYETESQASLRIEDWLRSKGLFRKT